MSGFKALFSSIGFFVSTLFWITAENTAFADDMVSVYRQAENNNLQVDAAFTDYRILQERRNEIASEFDPSLSLNVSPGYSLSNRVDRDRATIDYSFSLTKPLYQKQLNSRLSQADSIIQREQVNLEFQKQQLIARVATAYINFASAQDNLKFSLSEQSLLRQNFDQTNALFNSQLVTITDVSETRLLLEQSIYSSSIARIALETARKDLQIETGITYPSLSELDGSSELPVLQPSQLRDWIALANHYSHELQLARYDSHIQKKDVRVQRDLDSTSIDLFASYEGETGAGNTKSDSRGGKVGLELNIPLFSGDRSASKIRGSKLQYQKTQYALDIKRREISQNIQLGFLTVNSGLENIRVLRNTVLTSEQTLSTNQRGRAAGTRTVSDVLSAMRDSFAVKRSYTEARYKFLNDLVNLRLTAGVLSIDDLRSMSSLFTSSRNQGRNFNAQASSIESSFGEAENELMSLEDAWGLN
jgi:outer membrane protein